jgi:hypothetical protein
LWDVRWKQTVCKGRGCRQSRHKNSEERTILSANFQRLQYAEADTIALFLTFFMPFFPTWRTQRHKKTGVPLEFLCLWSFLKRKNGGKNPSKSGFFPPTPNAFKNASRMPQNCLKIRSKKPSK